MTTRQSATRRALLLLETMAGGLFVVHEAEITIRGSRVPVILSERGKLVTR
ncbi:MAG TPA: hypothetical protein VM925_35195 [Labilithrix sp.]|nr:hypothetical protein [Labilithrix sp.]